MQEHLHTRSPACSPQSIPGKSALRSKFDQVSTYRYTNATGKKLWDSLLLSLETTLKGTNRHLLIPIKRNSIEKTR